MQDCAMAILVIITILLIDKLVANYAHLSDFFFLGNHFARKRVIIHRIVDVSNQIFICSFLVTSNL